VLISMTLVTGLVDAFSYLVLGHVFVANMTGNVVFLGFALAGAPGFSIGASLAAMAAFAVGALLGGRLAAWHCGHRGRLHSSAAAAQSVFLAVAVILAAAGSPPDAGFRYGLIGVLAISMGIQNAAARTLAVPDLIRHAQLWCPLLIALVVIVAGAAATYTLGKPNPAWVHAPARLAR
jgi:uncharacterized membrane protein YoaK (UPF0700 family)